MVVKKVEWWENYEFVSVIPYWKWEWHSKEIFFDNKEEFLDSLEFTELKKPSN